MALVREKKQAERAAQAAGRKVRERRARVAGEAEAAEVRLPPWRELVGKGPREGQRSADEAASAGAPPAQVEAVPAEAKEDAAPPEQEPAAAAEAPASQAPVVEETAPLEEPAMVEPPALAPVEAVEVAAAGAETEAIDAPAGELVGSETPTPEPKAPPVLRWARSPRPLAPDLVLLRRSLARSRGESLPDRVDSALPGLSPALSSGVTIHVDAAAAEAAEHLHAEAFTIGTHVYFAAGRFDPDSRTGLDLLSHELAHVDQFREGRLHGLAPLSHPDDAVEHDAAARALRLRMPPSSEGLATSPVERGEPSRPRPPTLIASPPTNGPLPRSAPILRRATDSAKEFLGKPYFQQAEGWSEAGSTVDGALALDAAATKQAFPSPKAELGPATPPAMPTVAAPSALAISAQVPEPGTDTAQIQPEPTEAVAPPPTPSTPSLPTSADGDASAAQANFAAALDRVPTTLDSLSTDPGPPPDVALDGAADPALADEQARATTAQVGSLHEQARANVDHGPGPEQVQPRSLHTELEIPEPTAPISDGLGEVPRMAELDANETITEEVQAKTDELGQAQLDATLAEAKTQLDTAATEADEKRAEEVAKAEQENARLSAEANAEQEQAVTEARADIETGREDTKRQQQQEVEEAEVKSQEERDKLQGDVDARIEEDEGRIESEFAAAEADAEARKQAAETEAAREKEEAEQASEDDSWWSRALDAIADAFDALTSLIGDIFDAAISAVGEIIDAAKSLAADIINAARQFVVSALQALGDVLGGLVDELLGDIFPELAAALNELIDAAVDLAVAAVNALADGLIAGINALLDAIGGAITGILEGLRAGINAALAFATALVTGDWEALGRMILEAALQLAGISPDDFYAFVGQVTETIGIIVDDPLGFLGNLFGAVQLGFEGFVTNIIDHLRTGFFEWIVGPLGELGITLPQTWDVWSILGIVLQVLGLTQQGIRGVIVDELGETAGAIFDFVWGYVDALITGGWQGLWEQIQQDLSSLWDMVVDGIKGWLIETIITQGTLKLLSLIDPSGISAIVQVVVTCWQIYTFLRDNLQRIWGVVTSIVNTLSEIAHGALDNAAALVEDALASLIPIAISLLANLLGLGGITARVREIIEGIRETVRNAIRSLIRRVRGLFRGGGDSPQDSNARPEDDATIGRRLSFEAGGESHSIWAEDQGTSATVFMASEQRPVALQLDWAARVIPNYPEEQQGEARRLLNEARSLTTDAEANADRAALDGDDAGQAEAAYVEKSERLKTALDALWEIIGHPPADHELLARAAVTDIAAAGSGLGLIAMVDEQVTKGEAEVREAAPQLEAGVTLSFEHDVRALAESGAGDVRVTIAPNTTTATATIRGENAEDRISLAQNNPQFHREFTLADWSSHFLGRPQNGVTQNLSESAARADMLWGRENGKIAPGSGSPYVLERMSYEEIRGVAVTQMLAEGRSHAVLGSLAGFAAREVGVFVREVDRLPPTSRHYENALYADILTDVERSRDVTKFQFLGNTRYTFAAKPARRKLPVGWDGTDVRNQFYINGSGFESKKPSIFTRDFAIIEALENQLSSGNPALVAQAQEEWSILGSAPYFQVPTGSEPGSPYDSTYNYRNRSDFDVDHTIPLAMHWQRHDGNNMAASNLREMAGGDGNLRIMLSSKNRGKGAEGAGYMNKPWVGPSFISPGEEAGKGWEWATASVQFDVSNSS